MAKKKHYACYHSCKCMYMSVSKDDSTNEINNSYWTQQYNIISISAINFNTHVCISLLFSLLYMGGRGGYWTIYRNNLENHLLLSGAGLDAYKLIAFWCSLDAYFKRVVGRSFGNVLGKGSRFLWEVHARIVWMECTFFGMQVQALLKSSNQVSARVCEANSLY